MIKTSAKYISKQLHSLRLSERSNRRNRSSRSDPSSACDFNPSVRAAWHLDVKSPTDLKYLSKHNRIRIASSDAAQCTDYCDTWKWRRQVPSYEPRPMNRFKRYKRGKLGSIDLAHDAQSALKGPHRFTRKRSSQVYTVLVPLYIKMDGEVGKVSVRDLEKVFAGAAYTLV